MDAAQLLLTMQYVPSPSPSFSVGSSSSSPVPPPFAPTSKPAAAANKKPKAWEWKGYYASKKGRNKNNRTKFNGQDHTAQLLRPLHGVERMLIL
jgi:hypothetical protein